MKKIEVVPVGIVHNSISETGSPLAREMVSLVILSDLLPDNLYAGLEFFSHIEIIFYFDLHGDKAELNFQHHEKRLNYGSKLFGTSIVNLLKKDGQTLTVKGLDAINGTLVIDVKPVMSEFLPKDAIVQPEWSKKISGNY